MYKNVFSQLAKANRQRNEANQKASEQQEVEMLLSFRNDNTNADEAAIFIKIILWGLTIFMIYLGFEYYSKTFAEMFPPEIAFAFAVALPAVVEIAKIKLVGKFFRAWVFGWMGTSRHWSGVAYWFIVGGIGLGAFVWSYSISTGGIKEVAKQNAEIKNKQAELNTTLSLATAGTDAQIKSLENSNAQIGPLKNAKGRTNWESQPILASNAESLKSLYAQKEQITRTTTEEYQKNAGNIQLKVSAWAQFIERFGGWGEWGVFICLCAVAFFERRLFEANKDAVKAAESAVENKDSHTLPPYQANGHPQHIQNQAAQRYYFNRPSPTGNVIEAALDPQPLFSLETVAQPEITVAQPQIGNYADSVLELCRQNVQKEMGNFRNPQALKGSVSRRICDHLDIAYAALHGDAFAPTYPTGLRLYNYLQTDVFPMLNGVGHPYSREKFFLSLLYQRFKPQEQPTQ